MDEKSLESLPIDIHYNKLLDWLIDRRHCNQQWQASALIIREKINNAIQDMPPVEEITKLLQGTYINYFHCLRIVELLKETEKGTKNIFGSYSSKRMKDWQEIIKLYEQGGVGLGEVAQLLSRNVNYEIPSLKKQTSKCKQQQNDCSRKEGEYASQASEMKAKYQSSCKELGIEGNKVKFELLNLIKELPVVFDGIATSAKDSEPALKYYSAFVKFTLNSRELADSCTPMLRFLVKHGNTTAYEWRTGKKPGCVVEDSLINMVTDDESEITTEDDGADIDWGEVDYGIDIEQSGQVIDCGDGVQVEISIDKDGIDFGEQPKIEIELVGEDGSILGGGGGDKTEDVVTGEDALTLLDNSTTRNEIFDELLEMDAFLTQRLGQSIESGDVLSNSQFQSAPDDVQIEAPEIEKMKTLIQSMISSLSTVKMHHLFLIRNSPRYVDRLAESLKETLSKADKMQASQRLMVQRRAEVLEEERQIEPKVDLIRQKTKELKKQIELEISKKYKNRPVNIMGEINTV